MSLPSQSPRPAFGGGSRFRAARRKRRGGPPLKVLGLLGIVVVIGAVWIVFWNSGGGGGPDTAAASGSEASEENGSAEPEQREKPLPRIGGGPPTTPSITMGESPADDGPAVSEDRTPTRPEASASAGDDAPSRGNAGERTRGDGPPGASADAGDRGSSGDGALSGNGGSSSLSGTVGMLVDKAKEAQRAGYIVEARDLLNQALHHSGVPDTVRAELRDSIEALNEKLVFSGHIADGDPIAASYTIVQGDSLSEIAPEQNAHVEWRFIARINGIGNPSHIRVGQEIKLVKGPFHAVIDKRDFRLDLYGDARDAAGNRLFIRSFSVGLGEDNSTPVGSWVVREGKTVNPSWRNPRTGEFFSSDDEKNPIGERWIGLKGTDSNTELMEGYGIHGTIEPESIGTQRSMGCVRCLPRDIELLYEVLMPGVSEVEIVQ